MFVRKPLIYLAGPYTKGDQALNVRSQLRIMNMLMDDGRCVPYAPLLSHFSMFVQPRTWEDWMEHGYQIISRCDGLLRMAAADIPMCYSQFESKGSDLEERFAKSIGIPVFLSTGKLFDYLKQANAEACNNVSMA